MKDKEILNRAIKTAQKAGQAALSFYNSEVEVEQKSDNSPITQADKESNRIIIEELKDFDYGILSEEKEDDKTRSDKDRVWIIDPLDGTKDFIHQTDEFAVMIGLVERSGKIYRPVLGVVYVPARDVVYYGLDGQGAYVQKGDEEPEKLGVSQHDDPSQCRIVVSRFHGSDLEEKVFQSLGLKEKVPCGSVGVKVSKIASGEAELNFNPSDKTWEWDVCAPEAILREAGGTLTDMDGRFFNYNKEDPRNYRGYLATFGEGHNRIIEELEKYEKDQS